MCLGAERRVPRLVVVIVGLAAARVAGRRAATAVGTGGAAVLLTDGPSVMTDDGPSAKRRRLLGLEGALAQRALCEGAGPPP